jgi:hypothetical protein
MTSEEASEAGPQNPVERGKQRGECNSSLGDATSQHSVVLPVVAVVGVGIID